LRTETVLNNLYSRIMTTAQTIAIDFDDEMKNTRKLLERVPMDDAHRDYKPHEKSMPLGILATHVAGLPSWPKMALESQLFELQPDFKPRTATSAEELLEMFDRSVEEGRAAIDRATEDDIQKTWPVRGRCLAGRELGERRASTYSRGCGGLTGFHGPAPRRFTSRL